MLSRSAVRARSAVAALGFAAAAALLSLPPRPPDKSPPRWKAGVAVPAPEATRIYQAACDVVGARCLDQSRLHVLSKWRDAYKGGTDGLPNAVYQMLSVLTDSRSIFLRSDQLKYLQLMEAVRTVTAGVVFDTEGGITELKGPAASAGLLKRGDRIAFVDRVNADVELASGRLQKRLDVGVPGSKVLLGVVRDGRLIEVSVERYDAPGTTDPMIRTFKNYFGFFPKGQGSVRIATFIVDHLHPETVAELAGGLAAANKEGADGVILDLSLDCNTASPELIARIAALFTRDGTVLRMSEHGSTSGTEQEHEEAQHTFSVSAGRLLHSRMSRSLDETLEVETPVGVFTGPVVVKIQRNDEALPEPVTTLVHALRNAAGAQVVSNKESFEPAGTVCIAYPVGGDYYVSLPTAQYVDAGKTPLGAVHADEQVFVEQEFDDRCLSLARALVEKRRGPAVQPPPPMEQPPDVDPEPPIDD